MRPGGQTCPPKCSAKEQDLSCRHGTSVRGKQNPDHAHRVIATNLVIGTATLLAQCKAGALADVQQRIKPKPRQDTYEFQLEEFLETVEGTRCADG